MWTQLRLQDTKIHQRYAWASIQERGWFQAQPATQQAKYENHGMEKFDGWNNLKTSDDRTEWLNGINGDDDLNIRMFVK